MSLHEINSFSAPALKTTVILPSKGLPLRQLKELWEYRELFYFLTWRVLIVRYKQTLLGVGWAIMQPLLPMIIFTLFFGKLAAMPSDGVPYALFALTGLVPWMFFLNGATNASTSIIGEGNLIKKVYFPRMIIPISQICAGLLDICLSFLMLLCVMFYYDIYPTWRMTMLPGLMFFAFAATCGAGLWLSALTVFFRDIRYATPFFLQLWMFVTPIVYPSSLVPEVWRPFLGLNPIAGVVESFRWMVFGTPVNLGLLLLSLTTTLLLGLSGVLFFRKVETSFADVV